MRRALLIALLASALMAAYAMLVMGTQKPGAPLAPMEDDRLPDTRLDGYTGDDLARYLTALGAEKVAIYDRMLAIWDNLFPLVYGAMDMAWLAFIFKGIPIRKFRWLIVVLPLLAMGMDFCENFLIREQLMMFKAGNAVLDTGNASLFTQLKWAVALPLNGMIGVGVVVVVLRGLWRRRKASMG